MFPVISKRHLLATVQRLGFRFGLDVVPDRDLGRGLDLSLLSAPRRCNCKFAVARFTFVYCFASENDPSFGIKF